MFIIIYLSHITLMTDPEYSMAITLKSSETISLILAGSLLYSVDSGFSKTVTLVALRGLAQSPLSGINLFSGTYEAVDNF